MIYATPATAEEVIVRWMRDWLDLLAAGALEEACARLDAPGSDGRRWTPALLLDAVEETFDEGSRFGRAHPQGPVFTPVDEARGDPQVYVYRLDDGTGYAAEHNVPLNGEISDLTALFQFTWRGEELATALYDLLVL